MNYKSIPLTIVFAVACTSILAQKNTYQVKADTVRIFSNCDTAELILENRTRAVVNGVLTNKGNGVTEFRKTMIKLNDSMYAIGGDTLNTAAFGKNIYNSNGLMTSDRLIDGNNKSVQFSNNKNFLIAGNTVPVLLSQKPVDSALLSIVENVNKIQAFPFAGLQVRGTGCDACITLLSDSAGSCNEEQMIDFATLKPRHDSWLSTIPYSTAGPNKYLLGRIVLQTSKRIPDYSTLSFAIKSDTAFYKDGAYVLYNPGTAGGYTPYPVMSVNPSFKHPTLGYNTRMPFVQVNGGLFVGYGRNWYYNSKSANDIIDGVDNVPGYLQPFYDTRFSVYADSLPLKIYKLPSTKGNAFLTYSPTRTVEGNNVAFEYKDSVYEEIRNYISQAGLLTPSDLNLKENISLSQFDSDKLLGLRLRDFNYRRDAGKIRYTGLIAQEVKLIIPELVAGKEGQYGIDYMKMVPYLLKLVQDQQREIERLKQLQLVSANDRQLMPDMLAMVKQMQQQLLTQQEAIKQLQDSPKKLP